MIKDAQVIMIVKNRFKTDQTMQTFIGVLFINSPKIANHTKFIHIDDEIYMMKHFQDNSFSM